MVDIVKASDYEFPKILARFLGWCWRRLGQSNTMKAFSDYLVLNEEFIRLTAFGAIVAVMAFWEWAVPRRAQIVSRWTRWPNNIAVIVVGALLVRLVFPMAAVGSAVWAGAMGIGLFNVVRAPDWAALIGSVIILDLAIYFQHRVFHAVPSLWRLHRMHHADLEIDVTTGARFHPLEILISMAIKMAIVALIGAPVAAVVLFEVLLNVTSMFNHSNIRMPEWLDRALRVVVVTPDMHRVHHSIVQSETDSNFGFNAPWWDRLFGTYRPAPMAGHQGMIIGIDQFRDPSELRLDRLLTQPFRKG